LAHEWGHLNQARIGLLPAAPPFRYTIQNELQADCQAGVYVGLEQLLNRGLTDGDALNAFGTFCELEDRAGTPWFDPTAHGSCAQRTGAFVRGYQAALAGGDQLCTPTGKDAFGRPTGLAAMLSFCAF
jgi:predicted metalloprotease